MPDPLANGNYPAGEATRPKTREFFGERSWPIRRFGRGPDYFPHVQIGNFRRAHDPRHFMTVTFDRFPRLLKMYQRVPPGSRRGRGPVRPGFDPGKARDLWPRVTLFFFPALEGQWRDGSYDLL